MASLQEFQRISHDGSLSNIIIKLSDVSWAAEGPDGMTILFILGEYIHLTTSYALFVEIWRASL